MTAHLFLGGPLDQQWRDVPRLDAVVVAVEAEDGPITSRMVIYYRSTVLAPGWFVPITVYATDPLRLPEHGAPMPGWEQGSVPQCSPIPPLNWTGPTRHAARLHAAIKARGFRP